MNSILSNERQCYICGRTGSLHRHHIFYGNANRRQSERYGCWIYLCAEHHNMSRHGIHNDRNLDERIKRECQSAFEEKIGNRAEFRRIFGKSYI